MTLSTVAKNRVWCIAATAMLVGLSVSGCGDATKPSAETVTSSSTTPAETVTTTTPAETVTTTTPAETVTGTTPANSHGSEAPSTAPPSTASPVPSGVYEATAVSGFGGVELVPIRIAFNPSELHIFAGCHYATGAYRLTDGRLFMDEGMSGKGIGCASEDVRNGRPWVYDLLPIGPLVTLDNDLLTLKSDRGEPQSIVFRKVANVITPLAQTVWWLTTIERNGTTSGVPLGLLPTIRISGSRIDVGAPCNEISGDVTLTDSGMKIRLKPTREHCTDPRGDVEKTLVDALNGTLAYSLNSDSSLTLTGNSAKLVFLPTPVTMPTASG